MEKLTPPQSGVPTSRGTNNSSESGAENPSGSQPLSKHPCLTCGLSYGTRRALLTHKTTCGQRTRTKCLYCDKTFTNFTNTRHHESKAHKAEYMEDAAKLVPWSDSELCERLASIEASTPKGAPFLAAMVSVTNLTKDQIRHKRNLPIYQGYLQRARAKIKMKSSQFFGAKQSTSASKPQTSTTSSSPSSLTSPAPSSSTTEVSVAPSSPSREITAPIGLQSESVTPIPHKVTKRLRDSISPSIDLASTKSPVKKGKINILQNVTLNSPARFVLPFTSSTSPPSSPTQPSQSPPSCSLSTSRTDLAVLIPTLSESVHLESETIRDVAANHTNACGDLPWVSPAVESLTNIVNFPATNKEVPGASSESVPSSDSVNLRIHLRQILLTGPIDEPTKSFIRSALESNDTQFLADLSWIDTLFKRRPNRTNNPNPRPQRPYNDRPKSKGVRAQRFKKAQDLYSKSRKGLADSIFEGRPLLGNDSVPALADIESLYHDIFETPSFPDNEEIYDSVDREISCQPITVEDIERAKNGWKPSSPGSDGITIPSVLSANNLKLSILFNAILLRAILPQSWNLLRTTLIPKKGDPSLPANWRPITITSAVQRLFHRVLASRIDSLTSLNRHQRGFVRNDGTLANTLLLDAYIKSRTSAGKSLNIIQTDITRAFDTVSHHSVKRALIRLGVSSVFVDYIMASLSNSSTIVRLNGMATRNIHINRGVKQGDPLSPLLFNMVLDELLCSFDRHHGGSISTTINCPVLAFADDLIILEDKEVNVPAHLFMASEFFGRRGMSLNPKKTLCYSAASLDGISVPRKRSNFKINEVPIQMIDTTNTFKYLGQNFNTNGLSKPSLANLVTWTQNLASAPLKPHQKLTLLRDYLIPRLLYGLQTPAVNSGILKDADKIIRGFLKRTLHLHLHTSDASLYARERDGGLGVCNLRMQIPQTYDTRLRRLKTNAVPEDKVLTLFVQSPYYTSTCDKIHKLAGEVTSATFWKSRLDSEAMTKGLFEVTADRASRSWIRDVPNGWSGRDFVRAVHLRNGNLPTKGIPSNPPAERMCRAGCNKVESICHVLQGCRTTHQPRIARHNEIVDKISKHCRYKNYLVEVEPYITDSKGIRHKPDLIIRKGDSVIVTDVQVSWEGDTSLISVWDGKRATYDTPEFDEAVKRRFHDHNIGILHRPIIIGARGIWPAANMPTVEELSIPASVRASCVHSALKWASSIHTHFMRSTWRQRR